MLMASTLSRTLLAVLAASTLLPLVGCGGGQEIADETADAMSFALSGQQLFDTATFGGNGRSCATCHEELFGGALSPERAQDRFDGNPNDPLFRALDGDNGTGASYARLLTQATIRIHMSLPPTVHAHDDPGATSVVLNRGVPTFLNVPALDPVLMSDGRAPDLTAQALDAVNTHFEPTVQPTPEQLEKITSYEKKQFSSQALKTFANGGPAPILPAGHTQSEKRGRAEFLPTGLCGQCHSGPMLNTTSARNPTFGEGFRFEAILAGFPAFLGGQQPPNAPNEIRVWDVDCPAGGSFVCDNPAFFGATVDNGVVSIPAPDPGVLLVSGNPDDVLLFKIPTLWGINETAPYFHDNSAATLEDLVEHYSLLFSVFEPTGALTAQQKGDIVAYMHLL